MSELETKPKVKYKIIIQKMEENKDYDSQVNEYNTRNRGYNMYNNNGMERPYDFPTRETISDALIVDIEEEHFKKIRTEFVKIFE